MALVLIVDDQLSVARSLVKLLTASGFAAQAVHSGAEALAFIRGNPVALVLLDMSMPDMTGVEVLRALRVPGEFPNAPPVVMFSGDDDEDVRHEATRLGAVDFVSKINPAALLRVVESYAGPERSQCS